MTTSHVKPRRYDVHAEVRTYQCACILLLCQLYEVLFAAERMKEPQVTKGSSSAWVRTCHMQYVVH